MANGHGGRRPGAGRPRKPPDASKIEDPVDFLRRVMQGFINPTPAQLKAAIAAARYAQPAGGGVVGKKEQAARLAEAASEGRYRPRPPPSLKVVSS